MTFLILCNGHADSVGVKKLMDQKWSIPVVKGLIFRLSENYWWRFSNWSKLLYLGGLCDSAEEFALPLKGDFWPFEDCCLKQMWKIEKCTDQIIPVQLASRRPNSFQARMNSLLKWIALLIFYIEIKILIFIRRNSQKENFVRLILKIS